MIMKLIKNAVNNVIKFYDWLNSYNKNKSSVRKGSPLSCYHGSMEKTETYTIFLKDCKQSTPYQIRKEEAKQLKERVDKLAVENAKIKQDFIHMLGIIQERTSAIPSQIRP